MAVADRWVLSTVLFWPEIIEKLQSFKFSVYLFWIYNFLSSDFWSSLNFGYITSRQTDRKQCIRAHRAYAQVGSKMQLDVGNEPYPSQQWYPPTRHKTPCWGPLNIEYSESAPRVQFIFLHFLIAQDWVPCTTWIDMQHDVGNKYPSGFANVMSMTMTMSTLQNLFRV